MESDLSQDNVCDNNCEDSDSANTSTPDLDDKLVDNDNKPIDSNDKKEAFSKQKSIDATVKHEEQQDQAHFKCNVKGCALVLMTEEALSEHKVIHWKFVCDWPECQQRFRKISKLTAHMDTHQKNRPFKCKFKGCLHEFFDKKSIGEHLRAVLLNSKLRTDVDRNGADISEWSEDISDNEDNKSIISKRIPKKNNSFTQKTCDFCEFKPKTKKQLRKHMYSQHRPFPVQVAVQVPVQEGTVNCDFVDCNKKFKNRNAMEMHSRLAHNLNLIPCDDPNCGHQFRSRRKYLKHMALHSMSFTVENEVKPMTFQFEGKGVKTDGNNHFVEKRIKTKIKKFVCNYESCGKGFDKKYSLNEHLWGKHKIGDPFECTECDQTFGTKTKLEAHQLIHLDVGFACRVCPQVFPNKGLLFKHMKIHRSDPKNSDFETEPKKELKQHFNLKLENPTTVECNFEDCHKQFHNKFALKQHKKSVHKLTKN